MFRKEQLIFVTLLAGCTTVANPPQEVTEPVEPVQVAVIEDNSFLESIDSTLEGADAILDKIVENKVNTENKISNLQQIILEEEELILNLEGSLDVKDSLLLTYEINNQLLEKKIDEVATNLDHALHKCTNECYPTIVKLNTENQKLLTYIDSLQNQVFYLDSLVSTNKKLSKKIVKNEIR